MDEDRHRSSGESSPPGAQSSGHSNELEAENERLRREIGTLEAATRRLDDALADRSSVIDLLHRVATEANRAASVEEAMSTILPCLADHFDAAFGILWLVVPNGDGALTARGPHHVAMAAGVLKSGVAAGRRRSIEPPPSVAAVIESGRGTRAVSLEDGLGRERAAAARDAGLDTVLLLPVLVRERAVGVVELILRSGAELGPQIEEVGTSIGSEIGRVVERTGLQKKLSDLAGEEQRRLGRELHDTVAQEVAGIRMLAETLRHRMEHGSAQPADVDELIEVAAQAQRHIRSLARGLVPAVIDAGGLRSALEQLVERIREEHGVSCDFRNPQRVVVENSSVATNLYYIAQEAVRNAVMHGAAEVVTVGLETDGETLTLRIADDGSGFRVDEASSGRGSGLRIMDYRTRLIGGSIEVDSEPGSGTVVVCRVDDESAKDESGDPPWQIGTAPRRTDS